MSEQNEAHAGPVVKVARDLSAIVELAKGLHDQAINKASDRLMPGGLAMVALGNVASLDEWSEQYEAAEHRALAEADRLGVPAQMPELDDDDDWEPPLQTLLFWSEAWRAHHGYPLPARPSLKSESTFIRWALDWAWDNEANFEDFARDVNRARVRLENVLYAGTRVERTRVICDRDTCEKRPRLVLVRGETEAEDRHRCPSCKAYFDGTEFKAAYAKQLRSTGAEKFVPLVDAIGTLKAQGRPERTIRKWLAECDVETSREVGTERVMVWWPDLWRLHLTTASRARAS